jgi:hypothetical protein
MKLISEGFEETGRQATIAAIRKPDQLRDLYKGKHAE